MTRRVIAALRSLLSSQPEPADTALPLEVEVGRRQALQLHQSSNRMTKKAVERVEEFIRRDPMADLVEQQRARAARR